MLSRENVGRDVSSIPYVAGAEGCVEALLERYLTIARSIVGLA